MDPLEKVGGAHADLTLDARKFTAGIDSGISGLRRLETTGTKTGQNVGQSVEKIGTAALVAGAAIAAGIGHAVMTFASFEKEMNAVRAVSGATGKDFDALRQKALDIGKSTVFSASEAASAMEELSKAGVSVKDILAGAADGATALAAAAGEGIPQAAAQMAQTLNIFKLAGDQAVHVADLFAAAASKTNAEASGIAEGLSNASAVFTLLGISVDTSVGTLALFNDQAIMGAEAGTALKSTMLALINPTAEQSALMHQLGIDLYDANGNFVGMAALAGQLRKGLGGLTQEQRNLDMAILGGSYGIRGLNVLYQAGAEGIDAYTDKVNDEGAAAEQAGIRNSGLAGALESLKGSVETAEIAFGAGLAPAVESLAHGLQAAADGFSSLSAGTQKTIGFIAVGTAGILLFVGAGIKFTTMTIGMVKSIQSVVTWLTADAAAETSAAAAADGLAVSNGVAAASMTRLGLAGRGLLGALAPLSAAVALLAVADIGLDVAHGDHPFTASISAAIVEPFGKFGHDAATEFKKGWADEDVAESLGLTLDKPGGAGGLFKRIIGEQRDDVIKEFGDVGITIEDVEDRAAAFGMTFEEALLDLADQLGVTTPEIEAIRKETELAAKAAADFAAKVPSMTPQFAGVGITTGVSAEENARIQAEKAAADAETAHNVAITEGISAAHDKAAAAADELEIQKALNDEYIAASNLLLPYTRGAENVEKATIEWNAALTDEARALGQAGDGIQDLSDDLPGLQRGFSDSENSIEGMLLAADKAGAIKLDWSDKKAFQVADAMADTEAAIDKVNGAIGRNQEDLSVWQSRLQLTNDVLGSNEDTLAEWQQQLDAGLVTKEQFDDAVASGKAEPAFANLKKLLDDNKISQAEYDEILKAGWWLHERSVGGIEDEQAQIAKLLPDLAEYVRQHDDEGRALKDLTPEQRGRIAALQDENIQRQLQLALFVKFAQASGQINTAQADAILADLVAMNPELKGILTDYGLIAAGVTGPVDADTTEYDEKTAASKARAEEPVKATVDMVNALDKFDDLDGKVTVFQSLDGKVVTIGVESKEDALQFAIDNADKLDGKEVNVVITTDAGVVKTTMDDLQSAADNNPIEITIAAKAADDVAGIPILGGAVGAALKTPPVDTSATEQSLDDLTTAAGDKATDAGEAVTSGIADGASDADVAAANAAQEAVNAVSAMGGDFYNAGWNNGYDYVAGEIAGLQYLAQSLWNQAAANAQGVINSSRVTIGAHSPSTKAMEVMRDWNRGMAIGARDSAAVELETRRASMRMQAASRSGWKEYDGRAAQLSTAQPSVVQGGHTINQTIAPVFNGITDTAEIIGEVNASVEDGFLRWEQGLN